MAKIVEMKKGMSTERTYDEWKALGFYVRKGQRARGNVFSREQVASISEILRSTSGAIVRIPEGCHGFPLDPWQDAVTAAGIPHDALAEFAAGDPRDQVDCLWGDHHEEDI